MDFYPCHFYGRDFFYMTRKSEKVVAFKESSGFELIDKSFIAKYKLV